MASVDRVCECCKRHFTARSVDVKRGWARFCSKSCKARAQEARTGQYAALQSSAMDFDQGWDDHKFSFSGEARNG